MSHFYFHQKQYNKKHSVQIFLKRTSTHIRADCLWLQHYKSFGIKEYFKIKCCPSYNQKKELNATYIFSNNSYRAFGAISKHISTNKENQINVTLLSGKIRWTKNCILIKIWYIINTYSCINISLFIVTYKVTISGILWKNIWNFIVAILYMCDLYQMRNGSN